MTPLERVRRTRDTLAAAIVASAALWGAAAALVAHVVMTLIAGARAADLAAVVVGLAVAGRQLGRTRAVWSLERTALWVEERVPVLQYSLVTAIDPRPSAVASDLARLVGGADSDIARLAWRASLRTIAGALAATAVAVVVVAVGRALPAHIGWHPTELTGRRALATSVGDRLASLTVQVTPPAYAHQPVRTLHDPSIVSGLVGSTVVIGGRGPAAGIQ